MKEIRFAVTMTCGCLLWSLGSPVCSAPTDVNESRSPTTAETAKHALQDADQGVMGDWELIGTWSTAAAGKGSHAILRIGRKDKGGLTCALTLSSEGGSADETCEITRSGNYLSIFGKVIRASSPGRQAETLFVTVEGEEMVGRSVSNEISDVRLSRTRSETEEKQAALEQADSQFQARAEAKAAERRSSEVRAFLPAMLRIPAGTFTMGVADGEGGRFENEALQHPVKLRAFELGIYAVTFAQWDACVDDKGCDGYRPDDRGWGREDRPVINVSWEDAQRYVTWLSKKTAKHYRLPTEAEWEYAARAGTTTVRYWGDEIGKGNANCSGCGSRWDAKQTAPVGSFKPNAFGLYDMLGNVWQWTEDCYHDTYEGAPTDGSAWVKDGNCDLRIQRGGGWNVIGPASVRSGYRGRSEVSQRYFSTGFRVARSLQ